MSHNACVTVFQVIVIGIGIVFAPTSIWPFTPSHPRESSRLVFSYSLRQSWPLSPERCWSGAAPLLTACGLSPRVPTGYLRLSDMTRELLSYSPLLCTS